MDIRQLFLGIFASLCLASFAYKLKALNLSGLWAAVLLGSVILGLGGWPWAVLLMTFFVFSSLLSLLLAKKKRPLNENFSKGSRRDAFQVFANGGWAGLLVIISFFWRQLAPNSPNLGIIWLAFAGSLAAANADTWGTELGVLSKSKPILINTGKRADIGTSGAISLVGTLSALAGSALIGLVAVLIEGHTSIGQLPFSAGLRFVLITLAGLIGAVIDSLLGATVQAIYFCPHCQKETERYPLHTCGQETQFKRGFAWMNNDWVNATCTLSGAIFPFLVALLLR